MDLAGVVKDLVPKTVETVKDYVTGCVRVTKIARRPNKEEFLKVLKLTGLGMIIIGLIGLLVTVGSMMAGL